jgi:ABC-type multidrug transport system ATPase subunit
VQRTCDAVAIVDRGNIIRQGPISDLLAGASVLLQVDCAEPERARSLISATNLAQAVDVEGEGLAITLATGTSRDVFAEVARILVTEGIAVYRLEPVQASLESWFLQVTSRLGETE